MQILEYMATGAYKIFLDFDLSTVHLHGCMLGNDVASYTELDWPEKSHLRFIGYSTADRAVVLSEVIIVRGSLPQVMCGAIGRRVDMG